MRVKFHTRHLLFLKKLKPENSRSFIYSLLSLFFFPIISNGQITLEFQDGMSPTASYAGTSDASISEEQPTSNWGTANDLLIDGDDPVASGLEKSTLLKWDLSAIPTNSIVQSASMTINVTNSSNNSYELFKIKKAWEENKVSWDLYDGLNKWQTPGAKGAEDREDIILASLLAYWEGFHTITLNAAGIDLVQSWVNNPAFNYGFILANQSSSNGIDFSSREDTTATKRPRLTITYSEYVEPPNSPPIVSIINPVDGPIFSEGEGVTISAIASDTDGTVVLLEFFSDTTKIGEDYSPPWEMSWNQDQVGCYSLTAKATDNEGAVSTSLPVKVVVTPSDYTPPSIALIGPQNGKAGLSLNPELSVSVTDTDLDNLDVQFFGRKAAGEDFTIIHWSDTQYYAEKYPATFNTLTNWIRDKRDSLNIIFAPLSGDCVQNADNITQWDRADAAMSTLEPAIPNIFPDGIPYGISPGNHDQHPWGNPDSTNNYNSYFGVSRFQGRSYYSGNFNGIDNDNHFTLFQAGGIKFIMVFLEYDENANPAVLFWANNLLSSFPDYKAIIVSHYIMNIGEQASFSTQGQAIYDALKGNPNLFLMLGGHEHGEGRRVDVFNGNTVFTLLTDYQELPEGGNGWLRLLKFSPNNNEITVQTYSPLLNQIGQDLTMGENTTSAEFVINYSTGENGPYNTLAAINGIQSGETVSISWPNLVPQTSYQWYAEVSDGISTTTSPVRSFTTGGTFYNNPPDIAVTNPLISASFSENDTIKIAAGAFDVDGIITQVDFFNGTTKLGDDNTTPFEISWNSVPAGSYSITAVATDKNGESSISNNVDITVHPAGEQVTLEFQDGVSPSFFYSGTKDAYLSEVNPTSNYGPELELLLDGDDPIGSTLEKSTLIKWDLSSIPLNSAVESVTITINVTNSSDNVYELYEIKKDWLEDQITWNFYDGINPWQTAGANGFDDRGDVILASLSASYRGFYTITLNPTGIALVQSWVNNPESNFGIIFANQNSSNGVDFNSSESPTPPNRPRLSVTYLDSGQPANNPPTVSINNPANGSTFTAGEDITISADAQDPDGDVLLVEFFNGATKLGEALSAPWEFIWNNVSAGNYNITAVATDNIGASSTSTINSITVQTSNNQFSFYFQDGLFPSSSYSGTQDVYLSEAQPTENFSLEKELLLDGDDPVGSTLDKSTLLKWDLSEIPQNSTIQSVSITINVTNSSNNSYELFEIKKEWQDNLATWDSYDGLNPWQTLGAKGPDDRGETILATLLAYSNGFHTIILNAAGIDLIQTWVDNPDSNFGFLLANQISSNGIDFFSNETSIPTNRPRLSITALNSAVAQKSEIVKDLLLGRNKNIGITASVQKMAGNGIVLKWTFDHIGATGPFIIEHRSQKGKYKEFTVTLDEAQKAQGEYDYNFANLRPDKHYFRLRYTDKKGPTVYSNEVEAVVNVSAEYELSFAFPNPFNATTEFTLVVAQDQHIKIEIYNILGHRVNVLYNGQLQAHDLRTFRFDGNHLPSGTYFYRVNGKTFTTIRRLLLSK
jgi:hypothetical protein